MNKIKFIILKKILNLFFIINNLNLLNFFLYFIFIFHYFLNIINVYKKI